jgi:hypothetical protein
MGWDSGIRVYGGDRGKVLRYQIGSKGGDDQIHHLYFPLQSSGPRLWRDLSAVIYSPVISNLVVLLEGHSANYSYHFPLFKIQIAVISTLHNFDSAFTLFGLGCSQLLPKWGSISATSEMVNHSRDEQRRAITS